MRRGGRLRSGFGRPESAPPLGSPSGGVVRIRRRRPLNRRSHPAHVEQRLGWNGLRGVRGARLLFCGILLAGACTRTALPSLESSPTVAPSPAREQPSGRTPWRVVVARTRRAGRDWNFLNSVAVVSPDLAWAVGSFQTPGDCCANQTLIEQWDGKRWTVVSNPGERSRAPGGRLTRIGERRGTKYVSAEV